MENEQNLAKLTRDISNSLLNSINLVEILEEITDIDSKSGTVITILQNNLKSAFENIENCRHKIFILDD